MKNFRVIALVAVLAVAPAVLAACGGSGSKDNDEITAAINRAATSGDPAACTDSQTQRFNEQGAGGAKGKAATKQCEQDAKDSAADSVKVANIKVDGSAATADVALTGGFVSGQTLNVALVKEGDQWKLDQLKAFVGFDRNVFIKSALANIGKDPGTKSHLGCLKKQFDKASDTQLQNVVTGNGGEKLFTPCFKGQ